MGRQRGGQRRASPQEYTKRHDPALWRPPCALKVMTELAVRPPRLGHPGPHAASPGSLFSLALWAPATAPPRPPEAGLDAFYLRPACPLLSAQMTPWHPSDLGSRPFLRIPVSFKSPRVQALRVPCSPPAYTRHCYNCAAV